MDSGTSSTRPSNYAGGGEATVSSFITFIILLAGVLGGLIIVVVVILVCKLCVKGKKINRRSLRDGARDGGGAMRVLQRYETINSDVFSDPSTASLDGIPLSPRKPLDIRTRGRRDDSEDANERTHLRSSYEKDHTHDHQPECGSGSFMTLQEGNNNGSSSNLHSHHHHHHSGGSNNNNTSSLLGRKAAAAAITDHVTCHGGEAQEDEEDERRAAGRRSPATNLPQDGGGGGGGGTGSSRRVSFQLDKKFSRQHSQSPRSSRRYTEGDFHYLKYAKITALPRQFSLAATPAPPQQPPYSAPVRHVPLLGAAAKDVAFRYSLDERLRILQQDAEKSFQPMNVPSSTATTTTSSSSSATASAAATASSSSAAATSTTTTTAAAAVVEPSLSHPLTPLGGLGRPSPLTLERSSPRLGGSRGGAGSRAASSLSQDGGLGVSSAASHDNFLGSGVGGGLSRLRLSPSPPRNQRSGGSGGDRWRRTPSASPSPPGEPVHRQVNVEVHYQHGDDLQGIGSSTLTVHDVSPQHYPLHLPGIHDSSLGKQQQQQQQQQQHGEATPKTTTSSTTPSTSKKLQHQQHSLHVHDSEILEHRGSGGGGAGISSSHHDKPISRASPLHNELLRQQSLPPLQTHESSSKHQQQQHSGNSSGVPLHVQRTQAYQKKATSHSLELVGTRRRAAAATRKVKSYEDVADYDVLQITEFSRGPFYNTEYDIIAELASPTSSKVRYNDTGSLEELQEETPGEPSSLALEAMLPPDESDTSSATINGNNHRNRELWLLRATLEEEEECSDTIRMEDMTSPDDSPDREHVHTTSFESTVPSDACASDQRDSGIHWERGRAQQQQRGGGVVGGGGDHHHHHQIPLRGGAGQNGRGRGNTARSASAESRGSQYPHHQLVHPPPHHHHPHQHQRHHSQPLPSSCDRSGGNGGGGGGSGSCSGCGGAGGQLLHPNYEKRRQSYRSLLSGRLAKSPAGGGGGGGGSGGGSSGQGSGTGGGQMVGIVAGGVLVGPASANNSFDSVETDGDVSDTSRHEVTTTSFESTTTTDNTDSTTESQHSRLRQMKHDSGYKSLETQQSGVRDAGEAVDAGGAGGHPQEPMLVERGESLEDDDGGAHYDRGGRRCSNGHPVGIVRGASDGGGVGVGGGLDGGRYVNIVGGGGGVVGGMNHGNVMGGGRRNSNAVHFERRNGRTASKKRREYCRERQVLHFSSSLQEPEPASASRSHTHQHYHTSGDSFDEGASHRRHHHQQQPQQQLHQHHSTPAPSKRSVFTRFFSHVHGRDSREKYLVRDYSIDEKTNQIFNEFLRQESSSTNFGSSSTVGGGDRSVIGGGGGSGGSSAGSIGSGGSRLGLRRSPRSQHRPRLQRKHTEPPMYRLDDRRRDSLAPDMRSVSLGSDSSASSARRLSPQDSIEEEEYDAEMSEAERYWKRGAGHLALSPLRSVRDVSPGGGGGVLKLMAAEGGGKGLFSGSSSSSKGLHEIPLIQLPEEEVQDAL